MNMVKIENYILQKKETLADRRLLLNVKINKNEKKIQGINDKIKEIDAKVDMAMEFFSPRSDVGDFTKTEVAKLVEEKNELRSDIEQMKCDIEIIEEEEKLISECILELKNNDVSEDDDDISENLVNEADVSRETLDEMTDKITSELSNSILPMLNSVLHKVKLCEKVIEIDPIRANLECQILNNSVQGIIGEVNKLILEFSKKE